ncbi:MAG: glycosyltransferase [Bacteroidetes bacterium]|nr:glycosyltransferase [Bacteroidota bacterium]
MSTAKVSVIIPVYNTELYLNKCLDSVINQTLKEIEIICINDGSKDSSLDILKAYAKKDDRIIIIDKKNGGQGLARNIAIKKATGEYLGFVDSDDWIAHDMFEKMYSSAKNSAADVTICEFKLYNSKTEEIQFPEWTKIQFNSSQDEKSFHWSEDIASTLLINSGPCNKIYRTEFVKNINAEFAINVLYEDILFVLSCILKSKKMSYVREPFYIIRYYRDGSTSTNTGRKQFDIFTVFQLLEEVIKNISEFKTIKSAFYKYKFSRYFFHYTEVSAEHKKEFLNRIFKEYDKADDVVKVELLRNFPQLERPDEKKNNSNKLSNWYLKFKTPVEQKLQRFNIKGRYTKLKKTVKHILFSHNLKARFRNAIKKLTP